MASAQEPAPPSPSPSAPPSSAERERIARAKLSSARAQPRPADVRALFELFRRVPGLEATFEEEKHLALLAAPLKSKGRLLFHPPAYLVRLVEQPEKSTLLITPRELRMQDRNGTEVIDLRRSEKVRVFVTALVQVFAGNEEALRKSFAVEYAPTSEPALGWSLSLTPKAKPLDQLMKRLSIRGEGQAVLSIEIGDPNGDRTVTRILSADAERRFDADEQKRWFGIEPQK